MANFNIFTEMSDFLAQTNHQINQQFKAINEEHQKEVAALKKEIEDLKAKLAFNVREPDKTEPSKVKEIK